LKKADRSVKQKISGVTAMKLSSADTFALADRAPAPDRHARVIGKDFIAPPASSWRSCELADVP